MKYGKFLPEKGTIGFVAPSFGCNMDPYKTAFENALRRWKRQGYHLDLGPNCYAGAGIGISNTPRLCGEELMAYYLKEDNDCLISCGGGELMCEILDYVDWEQIASAPAKWFMGLSDNTNMTYLLATICDTASIYGPCAASFGMSRQHQSLKDAFALLSGKGAGWKEAPGDALDQNPADHDAEQAKAETGLDTDAAKDEMDHAKGKAGLEMKESHPIFTVSGYPKWELEGKKDEENPLASYNLTERKVLKFYDGSGRGLPLSNAGSTGAAGTCETGSPAIPGSIAIPESTAISGSIAIPGAAALSEEFQVLSGKEIPQTSFSGRLLGGCMDCLVNLLGTRYDYTEVFQEKYREDGIIWFLEACDLNVFAIRRAMWQMEHADWFRYVKGFLIGRPLSALEPMMGLDRYQAVLDVAGRKGVPVVMDVDLGHLPPAMPLVTGSYTTVHVEGNEISVEMEMRP
ncbi:MAG: LD-carboxypeptidase [Lachnospiraceae bacterium]|nr:LD-carboxypeptidase [Lachnospiraceae bacterium]